MCFRTNYIKERFDNIFLIVGKNKFKKYDYQLLSIVTFLSRIYLKILEEFTVFFLISIFLFYMGCFYLVKLDFQVKKVFMLCKISLFEKQI